MTFLFIATIGPVQPFIASARRTRDLYVGSTLLSELSKAAAYAIVEQEGTPNALIFPAPVDKGQLQPGTPLNVANKIVAVIQHAPADMGEVVRKAIDARLEAVKKDAFQRIRLSNSTKADAQIAHLVEYSWVAVPFEDGNDYKTIHRRAEAILSARKNTHFFRPALWGEEDVEKSSIDGQRECVIPSDDYPNRRREDKAQIKAKVELLYKKYKAGPQERLSAVDLVKRLGLKSMHETVLSTSHIAALPFLDRLTETLNESEIQDAKKLWNDYIRQIEKLASSSIVEYRAETLKKPHPVIGNTDGALLFKERLIDDTEYLNELIPANAALENFFRYTDSHLDGLRPSPYYAILLADGDGMGKAIDQQAGRGPEGHQAISKALADFAGQVRRIVDEEYKGSLVYAGGDDVLALLPLHTVLDCARKLHDMFGSSLSDFKDEKGNAPTLSVGIAVVHHLSLLQDGLDLARTTEKNAKGYRHKGVVPAQEHGVQRRHDKDALAIIVKKRGGEQNKIVVSWDDEEEQLALLVALYRADIIPDGMAYELRTMMERLNVSFTNHKVETKQEKETHVELQGIIQLEAARILRRKLYFSRERVTQPDPLDIETVLSNYLRPSEISAAMTTPQDRARSLLLRQIAVQEGPTGSGFEIGQPEDITAFVDALIVAQTFAEALKPTPTKGFAE